jgi:hypothetical protein
MVDLFLSLLGALRAAFRSRANLALENLALRHQLANLRRTSGRPHPRKADRAFWIVLSRLWSRWVETISRKSGKPIAASAIARSNVGQTFQPLGPSAEPRYSRSSRRTSA